MSLVLDMSHRPAVFGRGIDKGFDALRPPSRGPVQGRASSPHMTKSEVRAAVAEVSAGDVVVKQARTAELAWRPAWAIRSRRGAFRELLNWVLR